MPTTLARTTRSTPEAGSTARVRKPSLGRARFIAGLAALTILTVLGTLATIAVCIGLLPGWRAVSITSGSMRPALVTGDIVLVNAAPDLVREGQIITYMDATGAGLVTHRVVSTDAGVTTRGDDNATVDPLPVAEDQIVGAARFIVPYVGLPAAWLAGGHFMLLALASGSLLGLIWLARFAVIDTGPDSTSDLE
jgi:signal peptidase I